MIQLAGIQTGKIYFVGKNKSETSQWLLKTFTNNKKWIDVNKVDTKRADT